MKHAGFSLTKIAQMIGIMAFLCSGCDALKPAASGGSCTAGTAQIQVMDNQWTRLCGCSEGGGQSFGVGQTLQCTVNRGTMLVFFYPNVVQFHQVYIQGFQTNFPQRPNPNDPNHTQSDSYILQSTGTFQMGDNISGFSGTLIVI